MEKQFTEEDLRNAYRAGIIVTNNCVTDYSNRENYWIKNYTQPKEIKEETVPVTFYMIKNICGWSEYCNVTNGNHYALNEGYNPDDREIFDVKISHAKKLKLI